MRSMGQQKHEVNKYRIIDKRHNTPTTSIKYVLIVMHVWLHIVTFNNN